MIPIQNNNKQKQDVRTVIESWKTKPEFSDLHFIYLMLLLPIFLMILFILFNGNKLNFYYSQQLEGYYYIDWGLIYNAHL